MKKGDTLPVTIQGIHVTNAVVETVEADRVTILIPGTRAVVGVRVSLTDETPKTEPTKETIIDGVDRPVKTEETVETPEAPVEAPSTEAPTEQPTEAVDNGSEG